MHKRWVILAGLLIVLALGGIGGWLLLPRAVAAVPGAYQHYLPDPLLHLVATPLPTALPAPTAVAETVEIILPTRQSADSGQQSAASTQSAPPPLRPSAPPPALSTHSSTLTPPTAPPPTATPLPPTVHLTGPQVMPQKFNNCGPANLTILLNHYGQGVDQLEVGAQIKPNYDDRNVSPWEMVDYVNEHTPLRAAYFAGGDVVLLKELLANNFPVIIEKGLLVSEWEGWMGHYLTLVGYDEAAQEFISLDTFLGPWDSSGRRDSYQAISELWFQFNNTFIVVYPPQRETAVHHILGPTLLDREAMWRQAAEQAQLALIDTPEDAYAWFNLGSSLTQLARLSGDDALYAQAAAVFDRARTLGLPWRMLWYQFDPYEAYLAVGRTDDVMTLTDAVLSSEGGQNVEETHLYRGRALQMMGETAAAEQAFSRARSLNPNLELTIDN